MKGRIKQRLAEISGAPDPGVLKGPLICPLCGRPIPEAERDAHHLVPKSRGGVETVLLHRICHRQIHALITESELARSYFSVDALLQHPELIKFLSWVKRKPPDFYERSKKSRRLKF